MTIKFLIKINQGLYPAKNIYDYEENNNNDDEIYI